MKSILKMAAITTAFALAGTVSAGAEQTKIGFSPEAYPPFYIQDSSGNWTGWEVEIAFAICEEAGLDCVLAPTPWDGIIPALKSGKIDVIMNSMTPNAERKQEIDFSDKYYDTPTEIIGPKTDDFDATPEGLKGKVLGIQVSTIHAAYAKKHFADSVAEIREYQTQDEANQDLMAGRIDATQADAIGVDDFLKSDQGQACCESKGAVAPDEDILGPGIGAGVRKGDTELLEKINAAIKGIRENGKYQEISDRYFDFDIYGDEPEAAG